MGKMLRKLKKIKSLMGDRFETLEANQRVIQQQQQALLDRLAALEALLTDRYQPFDRPQRRDRLADD
ncbi:hypothetical protein [Lyngbya confervoides]|uniref:Uncharacterized protein n=1 Tax=Lyngbya confervoides BDU141951 TaxID=1574623 RepID=A0ABD4T3L2_9CYAN|nr:hypothetical protein [Lyngbya confervoides]MCM1983236.1 hypothetical protein [Lyngbya confervoides BDU141951]